MAWARGMIPATQNIPSLSSCYLLQIKFTVRFEEKDSQHVDCPASLELGQARLVSLKDLIIISVGPSIIMAVTHTVHCDNNSILDVVSFFHDNLQTIDRSLHWNLVKLGLGFVLDCLKRAKNYFYVKL